MDNKRLLLLLERPLEPIFSIKGDEKKSVIVTPPQYLSDKHRPYGTEVVSRIGETADAQIVVPEVTIPSMTHIEALPKDAAFCNFMPWHQELAGELIKLFMDAPDTTHLMARASYAREHINPQLFQYAYSVSLLHRPDTKDLPPLSHAQNFPDKFIVNNVIGKAVEEVTVFPEKLREPVVIPKDRTASDLYEEHRLFYFREDIGINLHHWHWHEVYPTEGPKEVVDKDRRGELFYYMHHQIIARYNCERLANSLKRVEKLTEWREPIPEAYFPKLDRLISQRSYVGRVANSRMKNLNRSNNNLSVDIQELERWRDNITDAIKLKVALDKDNKKVKLDERTGIDILGNMIESSNLSINPNLYGNLHGFGHLVISLVHDPDNRHLEEPGVMGDLATAMRDPLFYRWHSFVDSLFQEFKDGLPQYPVEELNYPGIEVKGIQVKTDGKPDNELSTFWQQSDLNISKGINFQDSGSVFVRVTHLQHAEFGYEITVENSNKEVKEGTCRIFLSPKHDERGLTWKFREQKNMFIELDKFKVNLKPGSNTITRKSSQSSVTIPFKRVYRDLTNVPDDPQTKAQISFCGCGWPHNMLIPKGTPQGMPCELFVMISNYDDDKIEQSTEGECNDAYSYCGLKDKLYPDRRAMGYPFDRPPSSRVKTLQDFLTANMKFVEVTIKFQDAIK